MATINRDLILDVFLFNQQGEIAAVERTGEDEYEINAISAIILTLPQNQHPIAYIKQYFRKKKIKINSLEMLPAIYLNQFDDDPGKDYLVLSFKAVTSGQSKISGDRENPKFIWMKWEDFLNQPNLLKEYQRSNIKQLFKGKQLFYRGYYRSSDKSYEIINWQRI